MIRMETKPTGVPLTIRRLIPLAILLGGTVTVFAFGLHEYLEYETLRDHRAWLLSQVEHRFAAAVLAYMAIYTVTIALSVPGGAVLTIAGGFLFGQFVTTAAVVVAATLGATLLFVAARTALGDMLRSRARPWLHRLERGFAANALSYLLVLRLIPLFPFFVVNLVPAFLGVSLRTYVVGTFFGIVPGTFVYASVGAGLGSVLDAGAEFSPGDVLTAEVVTALVGLAVLALLPVGYKRFVRDRDRRRGG